MDWPLDLPLLCKLSLDLRRRLKNSISKNLPYCKIRVVFKSSTRISNFFQFKNKMPYCLRSNVVYEFSCGRCNGTYYGKTCRYLSVRSGEHSAVSPLTGKKLKLKKSTTVKEHMLFLIILYLLTTSKFWPPVTNIHIKVKESLLISHDEPILNKNKTSLPLYLFHWFFQYENIF